MERGRDKREIVLYWQQLSNDEEEIFLDSTDNRKCSPKLPMKKKWCTAEYSGKCASGLYF